MHSRGDDLSIVKKGTSKTSSIHPFSDAPADVLFSIFEKLEWIDRFRASKVCIQWFRQMIKIPNNRGEFPWLFRNKDADVHGCQFKLTDENSKRSYVFDQSGEQLYGAQICASKFGRILMKRPLDKSLNAPIDFFVYCPFSCESIALPKVKSPTHTTGCFTYSCNPTSPDCVFFAILASPQRIVISFCRIGDTEWQKRQIDLSIRYARWTFECVNGLLYAVLLRSAPRDVYSDPIFNSHVGTFDPKSREWKLIKNEDGFIMNRSSDGEKVKKPAELWQQVLFPVVYKNKELYHVRRINGCDTWDLFKYDMEEKQWVEQPSLGNRVLFIACEGSSLLVDAVGELSDVANRAFYGSRGSPSYFNPFSFSSRKIEKHRTFYVDDRTSEDSKFYEKAWIVPTI